MLEVANLSAGYGQIEVLHDLSFRVPQGQVVTLIGSNGAGKTTTMRTLSGMIRPRSGSVWTCLEKVESGFEFTRPASRTEAV